ncbi:MAG: hypothetical protein JWM68_3582 [Verrucomicrobiales bacterium]|nr:hypothetical protein [Verrucomicrobiales bacterium]
MSNAQPTSVAASTVPSPPQSEIKEAVLVSDLINLPSGKELDEVSAIRLASSKPTRLIVFAGPVDCGKTTLLTSLYELFQWNTVCGHNFAGSLTLPAFEQRCYLARTASENVAPQTPRTPYKGPDPYYLHLRTSPIEAPGMPIDFLFTDVSGEMFDHARNSTSECKELTFLKRSTHFVLLLDSEKAIRPGRWTMVQNSIDLLQSCIDCKMLPSFCIVNIVWAKFDHFESNQEKKENLEFRKEVARQFQAAFEHHIRLKFSEVAARPTLAPDLGFGKGVAELYQGWINHCPQIREMELQPLGSPGIRESEFFALRNPVKLS